MKKALLGTTALIAAGLAFGNAAYAADGVKLSIGGRYMGAAGVNFQDADGFADSAARDYVFKQDVEVYFLGETVLDNGLTVGARVELEGQTSSDQIDAVYAYFSGGFGEIRFGDTGEAMAQLCYVAPQLLRRIFGADSPNFNFSNARHRRLRRHERHLLRRRRQIDEDRVLQPELRRLQLRGVVHAGQHGRHPQHVGRVRHALGD